MIQIPFPHWSNGCVCWVLSSCCNSVQTLKRITPRCPGCFPYELGEDFGGRARELFSCSFFFFKKTKQVLLFSFSHIPSLRRYNWQACMLAPCADTHTHMHILTFTRTNTHAYISNMHTLMHTGIHRHTYKGTYSCISAHTYAFMHTWTDMHGHELYEPRVLCPSCVHLKTQKWERTRPPGFTFPVDGAQVRSRSKSQRGWCSGQPPSENTRCSESLVNGPLFAGKWRR